MFPFKLHFNKILTVILLYFIAVPSYSQQAPVSSDEYFVVENYYRVKWGYAEEFISLWKANHYPLLKKAIEKGDIISVTASKPRYHSGGPGYLQKGRTTSFRTSLITLGR